MKEHYCEREIFVSKRPRAFERKNRSVWGLRPWDQWVQHQMAIIPRKQQTVTEVKCQCLSHSKPKCIHIDTRPGQIPLVSITNPNSFGRDDCENRKKCRLSLVLSPHVVTQLSPLVSGCQVSIPNTLICLPIDIQQHSSTDRCTQISCLDSWPQASD